MVRDDGGWVRGQEMGEMRELPDAGHVRIALPGPPCSSLSNACKAAPALSSIYESTVRASGQRGTSLYLP
ncbi:hypothetical protein NQZ68_019869 [Dissostichus eleginoides]|nr:hypothetical protein NQZ68_019869 [Dissostichus eleginoides]